MRILIRTSKWAIWARRLGSFALPLLVIPVFMYRADMMTTDTFNILEVLAASVAGLALLIGFGACIRLWFTGDLGWGRAFGGMLLALLCLAPFAFGAFEILHYPEVTDVSTDLVERPALVSTVAPLHVDLMALETADEAFPNARTRRYQLDAPALFGLITKLVEDRGWKVLRTETPVPMGEGQINAVATRLIGWRDEVAIRVREDSEGASVAMRSAQLTGIYHDLGANGLRIEEFLVALDTEVTLLMRDMPQPAATDEAEPEVPETGAPAAD